MTLGELSCQGVGNSKKAAKHDAARRMLAKLDDSVQAGKSEATVSPVSTETPAEADIREEDGEMERIVQQEDVPPAPPAPTQQTFSSKESSVLNCKNIFSFIFIFSPRQPARRLTYCTARSVECPAWYFSNQHTLSTVSPLSFILKLILHTQHPESKTTSGPRFVFRFCLDCMECMERFLHIL